MESHNDFESFSLNESPSFSVSERKLKRLKKLKTLTENPPEPETLGSNEPDFGNSEEPKPSEKSPKSETVGFEKSNINNSEDSNIGTLELENSNDQDLEEFEPGSRSESEGFGDENGLDSGVDGPSVQENGSGAKRTLDFDSVDEGFDGRDEERFDEMEVEKEKQSEMKKRSSDGFEEKKDKKRVKSGSESEKSNSAAVSKRRADKERREQLKQLQAESQRLLRETRDAAFKSVPIVRKPISSLLEKIRQRKLEVSRKSIKISKSTFIDHDVDDHEGDDDAFAREVVVKVNSENAPACEDGDDKTMKMASEEAVFSRAIVENSFDVLHGNASNIIANQSSPETVPTQVTVEEEQKQAFRAPIDDTQDLFSDSQTSGSKDDLPDETPSSPLEEVLAPSLLAMNLKFDSAPPDDVSSDEEDNDKENVDPGLHKLGDLSLSSNGDPAKAFVDDEAEEEDDSDNDLNRFQDNEDDEDSEDAEELDDMIETGYEEKAVDIERRNELHQKWLEQQDAVGTENLLQRFKHGSKQIETSFLEEDDVESKEDNEELDDEYAEGDVPMSDLRMNLKKVKEMIPQMFTDKDDAYISSDDEETEKTLVQQCLFQKSEEQATILSPAEDKDSREVFGLIKKLNVVPETRKKAKVLAFSGMRLIGGSGIVSSKSSFLGRGSNRSLPSSHKQGSSMVRSFIFERDDSNSRNSVSQKEGSSELMQRDNQPVKTATTRLYNSQTKSSAQNTKVAAETNSGKALLEILKRSSLRSSHCTGDSVVSHTESVLATFKLEKPIKKESNRSIRTL